MIEIELTKTQIKVLIAIDMANKIKSNPSLRNIASAHGSTSSSNIHLHCKKMMELGYLDKIDKTYFLTAKTKLSIKEFLKKSNGLKELVKPTNHTNNNCESSLFLEIFSILVNKFGNKKIPSHIYIEIIFLCNSLEKLYNKENQS